MPPSSPRRRLEAATQPEFEILEKPVRQQMDAFGQRLAQRDARFDEHSGLVGQLERQQEELRKDVAITVQWSTTRRRMYVWQSMDTTALCDIVKIKSSCLFGHIYNYLIVASKVANNRLLTGMQQVILITSMISRFLLSQQYFPTENTQVNWQVQK